MKNVRCVYYVCAKLKYIHEFGEKDFHNKVLL